MVSALAGDGLAVDRVVGGWMKLIEVGRKSRGPTQVCLTAGLQADRGVDRCGTSALRHLVIAAD
jgi:hypothetical protein